MTLLSRHQLNLLPDEQKARLNRARLNGKLLKLAVLLLVSLTAGLGIAKTWADGLREAHQLAATNLHQLETNLEPFAAVRADAATITDRLAAVDQLASSRLSWTDLLNTLAAATPPTVQILAFTPNETASGRTFALTGQAKSRADAVRLKLALEATPYFSDLLLENTQVTGEASPAPITFTLSGHLNQTLTRAAP